MSLLKLRNDERQAQRKFTNVPEQAILKVGLLRLYHEMTLPMMKEGHLKQLPRRANGTSYLLRPGFFQGLLDGSRELKNSIGNDVSSAQADLRHLSLEQLLAIRNNTLDFLTNSSTHSAHQAFVRTMDNQIFEKLPKRMFVRDPPKGVSALALREFGFSTTIIIGVLEYAAAGKGDLWKLPPHWAVMLKSDGWPDCQLAIVDTAELSVQILSGENIDVAAATNSAPVCAVMRDLSTGTGTQRKLSWDIVVLDPCTEDVLSVMKNFSTRQASGKDQSFQSIANNVANQARPITNGLRSTWITTDASAGIKRASSEFLPRVVPGKCRLPTWVISKQGTL